MMVVLERISIIIVMFMIIRAVEMMTTMIWLTMMMNSEIEGIWTWNLRRRDYRPISSANSCHRGLDKRGLIGLFYASRLARPLAPPPLNAGGSRQSAPSPSHSYPLSTPLTPTPLHIPHPYPSPPPHPCPFYPPTHTYLLYTPHPHSITADVMSQGSEGDA